MTRTLTCVSGLLFFAIACSEAPEVPSVTAAPETDVEASEPIQVAETPRIALGSAVDAAEAKAWIAEATATAATQHDEDLDALLVAIHTTADGHERGPLIARYLAAAERSSPEALSVAKSRLASSFDTTYVTRTEGAVR